MVEVRWRRMKGAAERSTRVFFRGGVTRLNPVSGNYLFSVNLPPFISLNQIQSCLQTLQDSSSVIVFPAFHLELPYSKIAPPPFHYKEVWGEGGPCFPFSL